MDMITLTIDGKRVTSEKGKTILAAAREAGIEIPTLCAHEHLLPIGSCRLCLVEVEGYSEPMTACTTPALDGIVVTTVSEKLFRMRREFLQLILVSHPLDCPQCDKGGECRLQDLVHQHGIERAEYEATRQDAKEVYATPLIRYWELRCVLCGRCYHACREISGRCAIDIVGQGFASRIAAVESGDCISCGECLSLCPVGALTENVSPIKTRPWQSQRTDTTCPHCGFGCRLTLEVIDGGFIAKVASGGSQAPNEGSLCVRGRFGYDFHNHAARLAGPYQPAGGGKKPLAWDAAAKIAAEQLGRLTAEGKGIGFLISARATSEEIYLLSRIAGLLPGARLASAAFPHTGKAAAALEQSGIAFGAGEGRLSECDVIMVAGADLLINNHLLANQVRQAALAKGARVIVVDPLPASLARIADAHLRPLPGRDSQVFDSLSRRILKAGTCDRAAQRLAGFDDWKQFLLSDAGLDKGAKDDAEEAMLEKAGRLLDAAHQVAVIFGSGISGCEESLRSLLNFCLLKGVPDRGSLIPTALQGNARGALALLDGMTAPEDLVLAPDVAGLVVYEEDPFHFLPESQVKQALAEKSFVLVCDTLPTGIMDFAHVVVPTPSFAEKTGTMISGDGTQRQVNKACAGGEGGLDFLRAVLSRLGGKAYTSQEEVAADLQKELAMKRGGTESAAASATGKGRFLLPGASAAKSGQTRPWRLIFRDLFANHHLAGKEIYGLGCAQVMKDRLCLSPEDAARLQVAEGDEVRVESDGGAVTAAVSVKAGIRPGVLECVPFRRRGEMLSLLSQPAKVVDVSVRKA
jgi:predicted molibdopterin-dependent oxidoreductase YjgC